MITPIYAPSSPRCKPPCTCDAGTRPPAGASLLASVWPECVTDRGRGYFCMTCVDAPPPHAALSNLDAEPLPPPGFCSAPSRLGHQGAVLFSLERPKTRTRQVSSVSSAVLPSGPDPQRRVCCCSGGPEPGSAAQAPGHPADAEMLCCHGNMLVHPGQGTKEIIFISYF